MGGASCGIAIDPWLFKIKRYILDGFDTLFALGNADFDEMVRKQHVIRQVRGLVDCSVVLRFQQMTHSEKNPLYMIRLKVSILSQVAILTTITIKLPYFLNKP